MSMSRLTHLAGFDERVEANIDGVRVAEAAGWSTSLAETGNFEAGQYFTAALIAGESPEPDQLQRLIDCAYTQTERRLSKPYHPAYDAWRGLISGVAWARGLAIAVHVGRLLHAPRPRMR